MSLYFIWTIIRSPWIKRTFYFVNFFIIIEFMAAGLKIFIRNYDLNSESHSSCVSGNDYENSWFLT